MVERAYSLQPHEAQQTQRLESEHQELLAQYGAATLQREQVHERLPNVQERQRALVGQVAARLGITDFKAARIANGNLIVVFAQDPDAPRVTMDGATPLPDEAPEARRVNGKE
jgi:hypothetical protein